MLGASLVEDLELQIAAPSGPPILAATATTEIDEAGSGAGGQAGAPAQAELSYLGDVGTLIDDGGGSYTLDLGAVQYGERIPQLQFAITNAATAPADQLSGTFDVSEVTGFTVNGASLSAPIAAGQSYMGLTGVLNEDKFGDNEETIVFHPQDVNGTGYSKTLPDIKLTITDTLELPGIQYSEAWGDVHIITYNGTTYNFQAVGEFTLAKSRLPNDSFDIQLRLEPWSTGSSVSVIRQVAIQLGADHVTFDWSRTDPVWLDGAESTISQAQPTLTLAGGVVNEVSSDVFKVTWNTGETMTVTNAGSYINVIDGVPPTDLAGGVAGLQGEGEGSANDFQLADGTVLPQPLSSATLYGEYADSWRVTLGSSLFDYGPGQNTNTFTDKNFPTDKVTLSDLPTNVVSQAANAAANAGITDPGIAQSAELDYLATGDPSFLSSGAQIQKTAVFTTPVTVTPSAPPAPTIGVEASAMQVTEASAGTTAVTFEIYLTAAAATDTTVDYAVVAPDSSYLDAAAFGGAFPNGQATIAAGQTSVAVTINAPQGALGAAPSKNLQL